MKNNTKYQSEVELIVRFLEGELSETDTKKFKLWLNKKHENKILFEETKKIWEHTNKLPSIRGIDVGKDWQKTRQRIGFKAIEKTNLLPVKERHIQFWRVAAAIIILIGIGLMSKQFLFTPPEMIRVETAEFKKEITLPDGSMVFLNKNSELVFPEKFSKKQRLVSLSGEGYFEVAKNPNKKFEINIDEQAIIEVLGTCFNINSEKDNGLVDVNVLSGKVAFYVPRNENAKTVLTKNENALLQNGIISKNLPKDKNFLSWRTGVIYFENARIEEVCKILSRFYDREVFSEGLEDKEIRFTSTIDNQKLESVLEEIKLVLNLDYSISGERIIIHTPKSNKE